ncbi:MAG: transglutaminase family protein [Acetobacteraceae bacterium]
MANFIPWSGLFADDPFWQEHFVTTGRRLTQEFRGSPDAAPGDGASAPHDFHLRLTRRFGPAAGLAGKRARLFLRYPVEGGASLLLAPPRVSAPDGARIRTGTDRLEVMLTADAGLIEVAADYQIRCAPAALGHVAALPVAERALYLQPREGLIQITPRIAALAEALGGPERNPLELAEGFRDFIHGTLICGVLRYDLIPHDSPLDWVLQHRWFDCQLGSALLAALCRARNVPARLCAGHLLYRHAPTFHYWVEIWCPDTGWRGFDLLSWTLSVAGRDADWRGIFSGTLDPRLQTETLPRHFTGMGSASLPARWHLLLTPHADGAETRICERETGTLAVSDRLSFRPPAPA